MTRNLLRCMSPEVADFVAEVGCREPRTVIYRRMRCERQRGLAMMGRLNQDQGQLFYSFCLDDVVPSDHRVREIAAVLDLSWVHARVGALLLQRLAAPRLIRCS